ILPKNFTKGRLTLSKYQLFAANNTLINTYGTELVSVDLGLRRVMKWNFIVAGVKQAIIGADFLAHFGLLVDLKRRVLLDGTTRLQAPGRVVTRNVGEITTFDPTSPFAELLKEFHEDHQWRSLLEDYQAKEQESYANRYSTC
ncbi:hypothetical protein DMN91_008700, partial [Ooceraea biroi]